MVPYNSSDLADGVTVNCLMVHTPVTSMHLFLFVLVIVLVTSFPLVSTPCVCSNLVRFFDLPGNIFCMITTIPTHAYLLLLVV